MVSKGHKTVADAARLFKVHPATVSPLLAGVRQIARKELRQIICNVTAADDALALLELEGELAIDRPARAKPPK
jgi:hypothetical protein